MCYYSFLNSLKSHLVHFSIPNFDSNGSFYLMIEGLIPTPKDVNDVLSFNHFFTYFSGILPKIDLTGIWHYLKYLSVTKLSDWVPKQ